jgi:hypothetical protein
MRVVIQMSPAAPPRDKAREQGAVSCKGANAGAGKVPAAKHRKCGIAGSERWCDLPNGSMQALAARRRLVCVCGDDNSRRYARADAQPTATRPIRVAWLAGNSAHHHGINLWRGCGEPCAAPFPAFCPVRRQRPSLACETLRTVGASCGIVGRCRCWHAPVHGVLALQLQSSN